MIADCQTIVSKAVPTLPDSPGANRFGPIRIPFLWRCVGVLMCLCLTQQTVDAAETTPCKPWPRWDNFKTVFISADGRVTDVGSPDSRTVSEGQAYGLFFSLVANDKPTFEKILNWTQNNLAQGDLSAHLPSWLWGHKQDNSWGVIDANAASDADLWIAYTLLQAGRSWHDTHLSTLGRALALRILSQETASLPGLGLTMLPGPQGFQTAPDTWRLNPSYVPIEVLRGIETALPDQTPWSQLIQTSQNLLTLTAPHGFAPDWVQYHASGATGEFVADKKTAALGSYDAVRVYLWAGMLAPEDPVAESLRKTFRPMTDYVAAHGYPPEKITTTTGQFGPNAGPPGFSAAVIPWLLSTGETARVEAQLTRINDLEAKQPSPYFGQTLMLFGLGWYDKRFQFAPDGSLHLAWC